jgi:tripeptide aminopeptidase
MEHISERFMRYVQIDTTADPNSTSFPSSMKQKDLGKLLVEELKGLGVADAEMDEFGYVFGTVASTVSGKVPTICFCSHMDTAPDCSGTNIKPILHKNYDGTPITLPDDKSQVITTDKHKYLKSKIGDDLITASGHTLLGADDKAGVAIIMDYVQTVMNDKNIPHGDIRILFTPDEEVGRGVDHLDMKKLNADFGYTLDGGPEGSIENESFSADAVSITIEGISTHPGYAKGKLVNSIKVMSEFMDTLPKGEWSPETTEKREGFVHPVSVKGELESTTAVFIIRDHDTKKMMDHAKRLKSILDATMAKYPALTYKFEQTEQYRNMREMLDTVSFVTEYAIQAMKNIGIDPKLDLIRGGTDGSRLSFMGLPCPNIFTGEMAIHSRHEYVSVQDMEKAVKTLVELSNIWTKHT